MNEDLFIADQAAATLGHDMASYGEHLHRRFLSKDWEAQSWFDAHCRRYLSFLGLSIGPFTGLFT